MDLSTSLNEQYLNWQERRERPTQNIDTFPVEDYPR